MTRMRTDALIWCSPGQQNVGVLVEWMRAEQKGGLWAEESACGVCSVIVLIGENASRRFSDRYRDVAAVIVTVFCGILVGQPFTNLSVVFPCFQASQPVCRLYTPRIEGPGPHKKR